MYCLYLNWMINENHSNQTSAIKEICSWLSPWLDGRFGHLFAETWQPRTYFFKKKKNNNNNFGVILYSCKMTVI